MPLQLHYDSGIRLANRNVAIVLQTRFHSYIKTTKKKSTSIAQKNKASKRRSKDKGVLEPGSGNNSPGRRILRVNAYGTTIRRPDDQLWHFLWQANGHRRILLPGECFLSRLKKHLCLTTSLWSLVLSNWVLFFLVVLCTNGTLFAILCNVFLLASLSLES